MNEKQHGVEEVKAAERLQTQLSLLLYVGAVALVTALGVFTYNFWAVEWASNTDKWGEFGDYLGGVLNPIFGFLSLIAILGAMALQVRELKLSTQELANSTEALHAQNKTMRKQAFEATFFQLLRLQNEVTEHLTIPSLLGYESRGREVFPMLLSALEQPLQDGSVFVPHEIAEHADQVLEENEPDFGNYFRLLYNIFNLVKQTEGIDASFYTNLVSAQMTSTEVRLLYYYGISSQGAERFKPLIEEFALLKNMSIRDFPCEQSLQRYRPAAFGGNYPTKPVFKAALPGSELQRP